VPAAAAAAAGGGGAVLSGVCMHMMLQLQLAAVGREVLLGTSMVSDCLVRCVLLRYALCMLACVLQRCSAYQQHSID
jgi:hypothetical protein